MSFFKSFLTLLGIVCLSCHFTIALDCDAGFYGNNCNAVCPLCLTCDKSNGDCLTCPEGYYTSTCAQRCKEPCTNCDINGRCLKCEQPFKLNSDSNCICPNGTSNINGFCFRCPEKCEDNVCRFDGSCEKCKPGFYGRECTEKCFESCIKCINGYECIKCENGFSSLKGYKDMCALHQEIMLDQIALVLIILFILFCIAFVAVLTYYYLRIKTGKPKNIYNNNMYYPPPPVPVYMDGTMQMGAPGAPEQPNAMYYAVPSQHQTPGYMTPQMQQGPQDQTQAGQTMPQGQHPPVSQTMFVPIPVPISRAPSAQPSQKNYPYVTPSSGPPQYSQLDTTSQGAKYPK